MSFLSHFSIKGSSAILQTHFQIRNETRTSHLSGRTVRYFSSNYPYNDTPATTHAKNVADKAYKQLQNGKNWKDIFSTLTNQLMQHPETAKRTDYAVWKI